MVKRRYKVKTELIHKLINKYGLCAIQNITKPINNKLDYKTSLLNDDYIYTKKNIIKEYKKQLNNYNKQNVIINNYILKCIISNIKIKYPVLYCEYCNSLNNYRIYIKKNNCHSECNKCVEKRSSKYVLNKLKNDDIYRFIYSCRHNIYIRLKKRNVKKDKKTEEILGCTFEFFISYIGKQFTKGMSFENYGKWHLDHIYPISKAESIEDVIKLNHYTNFQPLWASDNFKKSNKIID